MLERGIYILTVEGSHHEITSADQDVMEKLNGIQRMLAESGVSTRVRRQIIDEMDGGSSNSLIYQAGHIMKWMFREFWTQVKEIDRSMPQAKGSMAWNPKKHLAMLSEKKEDDASK